MLRGIVVTTWMLVFALGLAKSASAAPPNFSQEDSYTVLIYGDPRVFNRYHLGREIKHLEETFKRPVLAYAINSMQDFWPVFTDLAKRQVPIHTLVALGLHGGSHDRRPYLEVRNAVNKSFEVTSFEEFEKRGVRLNLVPGATVIFDSCDMVENEDLISLQSAFREVKRIGFTTGRIYLNRTDGVSSARHLFATPFWETNGGWKQKGVVLAAQSIWYIALPYYFYVDRFKLNQGYLYVKTDKREVIVRTHAGAVENGRTQGVMVWNRRLDAECEGSKAAACEGWFSKR